MSVWQSMLNVAVHEEVLLPLPTPTLAMMMHMARSIYKMTSDPIPVLMVGSGSR